MEKRNLALPIGMWSVTYCTDFERSHIFNDCCVDGFAVQFLNPSQVQTAQALISIRYPVPEQHDPSRDPLVPGTSVDGGDERGSSFGLHPAGALSKHNYCNVTRCRQLLKRANNMLENLQPSSTKRWTYDTWLAREIVTRISDKHALGAIGI
jgi:hypothetical protein